MCKCDKCNERFVPRLKEVKTSAQTVINRRVKLCNSFHIKSQESHLNTTRVETSSTYQIGFFKWCVQRPLQKWRGRYELFVYK